MAKPRIVVDGRMVGTQGHGIAQYVLALANAWQKQKPPLEIFFLVSKGCPAHSPLRHFPHQESLDFLHPLEPWLLPKTVSALRPALYHTPSFASLWHYPCPHIQTVHDLNHLRFGSLLQRSYYRYLLLPSLLGASAVSTVSHAAKDELDNWLKSQNLRKKISVIPNAIEPLGKEDENVLAKLKLPAGQYFFCLSNPKAHKNTNMLFQAHYKAFIKGNCLPLVTNVPGPEQKGLVRMGLLTGGEIQALMAGAKAFYFPSLYEGFGRPPLEAALAGAVPVVSDIPPHREALAGVREAEFLDPNSIELWEKSFRERSGEPTRKVSPSSQGWIQEQYSLEQLASKTLALYQLVLDNFRTSPPAPLQGEQDSRP